MNTQTTGRTDLANAEAQPMLMAVRQLLSIVILPCTVAITIPLWIARRTHTRLTLPDSPASVGVSVFGVTLLAVGVALFASSLFYFWTRGSGTLAPWDPPRRFVVEGPYRFVRNPMISGVIFVLFGTACMLRSLPHAQWAGIFLLINAIYIPLSEEPMLMTRFGEPYARYKRSVRRFVPRATGWNPEVTSYPSSQPAIEPLYSERQEAGRISKSSSER
jgi:protein-S-isoprenylcysteine O-methyltransferase Ste14